ncbi:hypothetical protein AFZ32_03770 [Listeria welshimeri]|uniref:Uncharacterized protein n=1 Tax=Listeria welshimeri TaxID=1643 RepID=A0ABX4IF46_LISWE|nr:hypothetical protein AFZ32_03770 [Listeria welshimeri]
MLRRRLSLSIRQILNGAFQHHLQVLLYLLSSIYPPPKSNNTFTIHLRVHSKANIWLFDFRDAMIKKKRGDYSAPNYQRSFRAYGFKRLYNSLL